jgi:hypothetical protein
MAHLAPGRKKSRQEREAAGQDEAAGDDDCLAYVPGRQAWLECRARGSARRLTGGNWTYPGIGRFP